MATIFSSRKSLAIVIGISTLAVSVLSANNFGATFGSSPAPFKIDVPPSFIEETVTKASLTRYTVDVEEPDFASGPPRHNVTTVRDYWVDNYDWFQVQDQLNKRYGRIITDLQTCASDGRRGQKIRVNADLAPQIQSFHDHSHNRTKIKFLQAHPLTLHPPPLQPHRRHPLTLHPRLARQLHGSKRYPRRPPQSALPFLTSLPRRRPQHPRLRLLSRAPEARMGSPGIGLRLPRTDAAA